MSAGAITNHIDVAQVTLYAFWLFFAGLIYYLRSEDKREGYPLRTERDGRGRIEGFPPMPKPKVFLLPHGGTRTAPRYEAASDVIAALPVGGWPGAPHHPTGNPMIDAVGPAAYALRADVPDAMFEDGAAKIVPLRTLPEFHIDRDDPDPRGMRVIGADKVVAGTVTDLWIDQTDVFVRYLEVEIGSPEVPHSILLPMTSAVIDASRRRVKVGALLSHQFAYVPVLKNPHQVTMLEEEKITAYYGGGELYATPARLGPLL